MRDFLHTVLATTTSACLLLTSQRAFSQSQNASMAQGMSMASAGMGLVGTVESGKDCACKISGSTCTASWYSCVTLPLHVLTVISSLQDAQKNGEQKGAITGASSAGESPSTAVTDMGVPTFGSTPKESSEAPPPPIFDEIPLAKVDPDAAKEICSKTPEAFICQADPEAAIDNLKNDYKNAYDAGALGDLPPGESFDSAMANFDKAKSQMKAMLANTDAFKKSAKKNANSSGAGVGGVGGNAISALKDNGKGAATNFGASPAKYFIENGLEIIDEASGKPLTLWQRATNRYRGSNFERVNTLARMENLRKNALAYLRGDRNINGVVLSKSSAPATNAPHREPASLPDSKIPVGN